jgi:hemolysin activation/secretion protein
MDALMAKSKPGAHLNIPIGAGMTLPRLAYLPAYLPFASWATLVQGSLSCRRRLAWLACAAMPVALWGMPSAASAHEMAAQENPCQEVVRIKLEGTDADRFDWLTDAAQPWMGHCLGTAGIGQLVAAMEDRLHRRGYVVNRILVPPQTLEDGELRLHLHSVRVEEVQFTQNDANRSPDDSWGTWWNAFPVGRGDFLSQRDLEQGVEQMQRLPGQAVSTEIAPGSSPDRVTVRILRQPASLSERWRGALTLDNSGSRALGQFQLSTQLELAQPFGLSDLLSLSGSTNAINPGPDHRSQSLAFEYSIPWGYNTFTFSQSHSRFAQLVQGTTVRFLSSGQSDGAQLRWHHRLFHANAARGGLFAAVSTRRANSFIDDVELGFQRRRTTTLEGGVTYHLRRGEASGEFEFSYRRGMAWRDAQEDLPAVSGGGPTLRPRLWTASAALSIPFPIAEMPVLYTIKLHAQHTRDTTLAIDQIAIGNRYTVRGFDGDAVLQGESGYFVRNEWAVPGWHGADMAIQYYAGADAGRVWGPSAFTSAGSWLAGAVLGLRATWHRLHADLALGMPMHKPAGFETGRWNAYLLLSQVF